MKAVAIEVVVRELVLEVRDLPRVEGAVADVVARIGDCFCFFSSRSASRRASASEPSPRLRVARRPDRRPRSGPGSPAARSAIWEPRRDASVSRRFEPPPLAGAFSGELGGDPLGAGVLVVVAKEVREQDGEERLSTMMLPMMITAGKKKSAK